MYADGDAVTTEVLSDVLEEVGEFIRVRDLGGLLTFTAEVSRETADACGTRRSSPAHEADKEQAAHPKWVRRCRLSINPGIHDNGRKSVRGKPRRGVLRHLNHSISELLEKF